MHVRTSPMARAPYGVAFAIEDLMRLRQWAESRGLAMSIALDQVTDNAEFEEMVYLSPPNRRRRSLAVWRTLGSVFLQTSNGRIRAFPSLEQGLASLHPGGPKRRSWLCWLGLSAR